MTRAPLKLSREVKLLLLLLLMVGLIGAWYVWTSSRNADDLSSAPTPTPVDGSATSGETPATGTPVAGEPDSATTPEAPVSAQPDGPVDVGVIPPFPAGENAAAAPEADVPATPSGINPDTPLASVPGSNPFRPLTLDRDGAASTPAPATAPSAVPDTAPPAVVAAAPTPAPVAVTPARTTTGSNGPLALTPIPGASGSISVSSPTISGAGALPTPVIPGATGAAQAGGVTPIIPGADAGGVPSVTVTVAPVQPPVAGVQVPSVTRVPGTAPAQSGSEGTAGSVVAGGTPAINTPQAITELGGSAEAAGTTTLAQLVQTQDLAFNAVVLGPVNTAIFRSKNGFVVVSVGQKLPDTNVTVKEVTATSATLALGNDTKTLELDKR